MEVILERARERLINFNCWQELFCCQQKFVLTVHHAGEEDASGSIRKTNFFSKISFKSSISKEYYQKFPILEWQSSLRWVKRFEQLFPWQIILRLVSISWGWSIKWGKFFVPRPNFLGKEGTDPQHEKPAQWTLSLNHKKWRLKNPELDYATRVSLESF